MLYFVVQIDTLIDLILLRVVCHKITRNHRETLKDYMHLRYQILQPMKIVQSGLNMQETIFLGLFRYKVRYQNLVEHPHSGIYIAVMMLIW